MHETRAMGAVVGGFTCAREVFGHRRLAQFEQERFVVRLSGAQA
jgi:hypothetical protein